MCDFIGEFKNNYTSCKDMIDLFENNAIMHYAGKVNDKYGVGQADDEWKISTELATCDYIEKDDADVEVINTFLNCLQNAINKYQESYEDVRMLPSFHASLPQIQKYNPKEGFFKWHLERGIGVYNRVFAYITYLNDVEDGGGTEFKYFNKTTKAEAGKTIIFPSDWTHMHRGVVSPTETKYIATGWLIADKSNLSFTD